MTNVESNIVYLDRQDGVLIEIKSGGRTPVQHVVSDTVFCKVPQRGKLVFLSVSPEGKFFVDYFDPKDGNSYTIDITKGWTMCLFAPGNQREPAQVLEYEEPGFETAELLTVPDNATKVNDHQIPSEFWETLSVLAQDRSGIYSSRDNP